MRALMVLLAVLGCGTLAAFTVMGVYWFGTEILGIGKTAAGVSIAVGIVIGAIYYGAWKVDKHLSGDGGDE